MSSRTARNLKRHNDQHETTTTEKPLVAAAVSADAIATGSALVAKPDSSAKPNSHSTSGGTIIDSAMREKLVSEAAYFRAERRDFSPGGELEDWIAAEREVDQLLTVGKIIPVGFFG